jgi:hypothetical protein
MASGRGYAAERRARRVAAVLGVPEFVYSVPLVAKGTSVREVGDGILFCGSGGAVLQVKSRALREGKKDSSSEAAAWLKKHTERAVRQGRGSKRTIAAHWLKGEPLHATPVRALVLGSDERDVLKVTLDSDCSDWPIIVIVSHPSYNDAILPVYQDAFCVTLEDWHELNYHLRSIHELLRYIARVMEEGADVAVPLGRESERFASLVEYDTAYAAQARGARPRTSFDAVMDPAGIRAYHELIDRTWGPNKTAPDVPIQDYSHVLDFLDDVPASVQSHVGRWIMSMRYDLNERRHRVSGSSLLVDRPLIYMCDLIENRIDQNAWEGELLALVSVRAQEWREQIGKLESILGIGVRVLGGGIDQYSYVFGMGSPDVPIDIRRNVEWRFGVANFRSLRTGRLEIGRNEACPCGSGRKYKRCHGVQGA